VLAADRTTTAKIRRFLLRQQAAINIWAMAARKTIALTWSTLSGFGFSETQNVTYNYYRVIFTLINSRYLQKFSKFASMLQSRLSVRKKLPYTEFSL
jgi:hypothetical protein